MKVIVDVVSLDLGPGVDIVILDETATVFDLIQAMEAISDDAGVFKELRLFPQRDCFGTCYGCTYCCKRFGIYLSMIDILKLAEAEGVSREEYLAYFTVYEPWKIDRIRLAQPDKYCLGEHGCGKYGIRPLICRLYICCPHTPTAKALIARVNGLAEEDLVDFRQGRVDPENPFNGVFCYSQVLLKSCVDENLWSQLFKPQPFTPVA